MPQPVKSREYWRYPFAIAAPSQNRQGSSKGATGVPQSSLALLDLAETVQVVGHAFEVSGRLVQAVRFSKTLCGLRELLVIQLEPAQCVQGSRLRVARSSVSANGKRALELHPG